MTQKGMLRAHVVISGFVQGVFFRSDTRDVARSLGLTGWVLNRYDGCVEALFEGPEHAVREMIVWCHKGPPAAHVEDVKVEEGRYTGEFDTFEITF